MGGMNTMKVMKAQCGTCPFRDDGWTEVRDLLIKRALTEASPICHSTGPGALVKRKLKKAMICRGARKLQAEVFYRLGVLAEPTVESVGGQGAGVTTQEKIV
jgi:hypothetical protein